MIGRDDRVELAAHRAHEHRVRRKWPGDAGSSRRGLENASFLIAKPSAVAPVRIQRTQGNPWLRDVEPVLEPVASDFGRLLDDLGPHLVHHIA
ncbi:MAG: hypothetical protein AUG20_00800 [Gemmatimonas sp. 13_1_20CM_3_60_15]|nr:MAG: hypothetical protein AUG20_00800 [Gemmatimonas sp. 13_1_20CM_3_60_15]